MESDYIQGLRTRIGHDLLLIPGVGALVRDGEGRLLVQLRAEDGEWTIPGGAIEPGETPAQAVRREVKEETGLDVRPVRVAAVFGGPRFRSTCPNGDRVEYSATVFDCEVLGGTLSTGDPETERLEWFFPEDLPPLSPPLPRELYAPRQEAYFED